MKLSAFILSLFLLFIIAPNALAVGVGTNNSCPDNQVCLNDPLGFGNDTDAPQKVIGKVIQMVLGVIGSLALLMVVYGGVVWMTAAGSQEKVKKGRDILIWAIVGLVVIFSSYAVVNFVLTGIGA
jgi:Type IV secretion system pilin